jgi:hypothetical protein
LNTTLARNSLIPQPSRVIKPPNTKSLFSVFLQRRRGEVSGNLSVVRADFPGKRGQTPGSTHPTAVSLDSSFVEARFGRTKTSSSFVRRLGPLISGARAPAPRTSKRYSFFVSTTAIVSARPVREPSRGQQASNAMRRILCKPGSLRASFPCLGSL